MDLIEILWTVKEGLARPEELSILSALGLVSRVGGAFYLTPAGEKMLEKARGRRVA